MISSPFNKNIAFSVKKSGVNSDFVLFPEEKKILSSKAIQKRVQDFYIGRLAAHCALKKILGKDNHPILKGQKGEPLWPKKIVGAITHAGDIAIAAVAKTEDTGGIGVDLEYKNRHISFNISKRVCTDNELKWITEIKSEADTRLKMIFSAKEAGYKAFYPIEKVFLDFMDAELSWNLQMNCFEGKLLKKAGYNYPEGYEFIVGCNILENYIFSFICLPSFSIR